MLKQISTYAGYRLKAKTEFSLHSPFLFELYLKVFKKDPILSAYTDIENLRTALLNDKTFITVTDLGAGSKKNKSPQRSISAIAKNSLKKKKYARFLHRLVEHCAPVNIIELGTSLGISTAYLAKATHQPVHTIEGCPEIYQLAKKNISQLHLPNVVCLNDNFDSGFQKLLDEIKTAGLIFFDGNHRKESTLNYFHTALKHIDNNSIFIFDDIHWSDEMEQAWNEITQHEAVTASIDLYEMGIVFFRKGLSKQDFILRY